MLNFLAPLLTGGLSLVGGLIGNQQKKEGQQQEIENQREFAQNGIRWKVEDATRAGVHPNVALGAPTSQYVPVGLGDNDTAASFSAAGQDISRAVSATSTSPERASAYVKATENLTLERMGLENELLRAQIMGARQPVNPPFPMSVGDYAMPGQASSGPALQIEKKPFPMAPGWSPAQDVEDQYTEAISFPYGITKFIRDLGHQISLDAPRIQEVYKSRPVRGSQNY